MQWVSPVAVNASTRTIRPIVSGTRRQLPIELRLASFRLLLLALFTLIVLNGCSKRTTHSDEVDEVYWVLLEIDTYVGHETFPSEDGKRLHNDYRALVLKRSGETIRLVYRNRFLASSDLKIGEKYEIHGLDTAHFSSDVWRGYSYHDVELVHIPD